MDRATAADRITSMRGTLQSIESQLVRGDIPSEGLVELKSAVDDIRLRVWAILSAVSADDGPVSLERFRLRRALEICRKVAGELDAGTMSAAHRELPDLREAALGLAAAIERARSRGA